MKFFFILWTWICYTLGYLFLNATVIYTCGKLLLAFFLLKNFYKLYFFNNFKTNVMSDNLVYHFSTLLVVDQFGDAVILSYRFVDLHVYTPYTPSLIVLILYISWCVLSFIWIFYDSWPPQVPIRFLTLKSQKRWELDNQFLYDLVLKLKLNVPFSKILLKSNFKRLRSIVSYWGSSDLQICAAVSAIYVLLPDAVFSCDFEPFSANLVKDDFVKIESIEGGEGPTAWVIKKE